MRHVLEPVNEEFQNVYNLRRGFYTTVNPTQSFSNFETNWKEPTAHRSNLKEVSHA
jgi:hypothetical protein